MVTVFQERLDNVEMTMLRSMSCTKVDNSGSGLALLKNILLYGKR